MSLKWDTAGQNVKILFKLFKYKFAILSFGIEFPVNTHLLNKWNINIAIRLKTNEGYLKKIKMSTVQTIVIMLIFLKTRYQYSISELFDTQTGKWSIWYSFSRTNLAISHICSDCLNGKWKGHDCVYLF